MENLERSGTRPVVGDRRIAIVIGGGPIVVPQHRFDAVIAADSGLDVALAAGLRPTHLVGDLDSISEAGLAWAEANEVAIERHRPDKDDTDAALALRSALAMDPCSITMIGPSTTDRLDHLLGALTALGDPHLASVDTLGVQLGATSAHVLHPGHTIALDLPAAAVFSLLALHGPCSGVDVAPARWPLVAADLAPGSTRGISNESLGQPVHISVAVGVLSIIVAGVAS
jgi:thiamine pyrophosphokinase